MKRDSIEAFSVATVATGASYGIAQSAGWITGISWLEVFAVFTSYVCTWLCVRQRRVNYPIGAVSSVAYTVLFWQSGLLASAVLNAYLVFQLVYGWFRWRSDVDPRPVTFVKPRWWPAYFAATAAAYGGAVLIWSSLDVTPVFSDIAILVATILAQFLLDNKKLETWFFWAVVNVFAIYTYFHASLPLAGFQYVLFLANVVIGFFTWRRSMAHA